MKTAELTGAALDWAVAKCKGELEYWPEIEYSTDWAQGGPIIEREGIETTRGGVFHEHFWKATRNSTTTYAPTPLIAAMRCYVASKLGDDIEIPEELNQGEDK